MSLQLFEDDLLTNKEFSDEAKIMINALKTKVVVLSSLIESSADDQFEWDHQEFIDDYFASFSEGK